MGKLTARTVATAVRGRHGDGLGLYLIVGKSGTARKWVYQFTFDRKRRHMGLGSAHVVTLAMARERAQAARLLVAADVNPIAQKKAASAVARGRKTFRQCAEEFIAAKRSEWRSEKHAGQWSSTIADYCGAILDLPVDEIDTAAVLRVLQPLWTRVPETASRLRGRIESILDFATVHKLRSGGNPAAWRNHLALILPKRTRLSRGHHASLPYSRVPDFVATLRQRGTVIALAVEMTVLCGTRQSETLHARFSEFDLAARIWTIPASRTKSATEHAIPLPDRAVAIVESMAAKSGPEGLVFAGRHERPVSATAMHLLCANAGCSLHGLRASLRTWIAEQTDTPREVAEQCLMFDLFDGFLKDKGYLARGGADHRCDDRVGAQAT